MYTCTPTSRLIDVTDDINTDVSGVDDGRRQDDARLVPDASDDVGARVVGPMQSSTVIRSSQASDVTHSDRRTQEPIITHSVHKP